MAIPNCSYSFAPGFMKLTVADAQKVRDELYVLLGCTSNVMFCRRKNNYRNMPPIVYRGITEVFSKYGVPEADVWQITKA